VRARATMPRVGARAHLDEDQRAVATAHDQVDFAAARVGPTRDPIIARHQHQPGAPQVGQCRVLGRATAGLA